MTNEEAIKILEDITWNSNGRYEVTDMLDTRNLSIQALQENTKLKAEIDRLNGKSEMYRDMADSFCNSNIKLKAEIEQLKATISKMETTTAQEDDLKQCYSCEFATKQQRKRIKGKVVRVTDKN